jgi:hypothetical protein
LTPATPTPRPGRLTRPVRSSRGKPPTSPTGIHRRATYNSYNQAERKGADTAADYLDVKAPYLGYATALAKGWPIATGVIEGACRHLVNQGQNGPHRRPLGLDGEDSPQGPRR